MQILELPILLSQKLLGWGPAIYTLISHPEDSDVYSSLKETAVGKLLLWSFNILSAKQK